MAFVHDTYCKWNMHWSFFRLILRRRYTLCYGQSSCITVQNLVYAHEWVARLCIPKFELSQIATRYIFRRL